MANNNRIGLSLLSKSRMSDAFAEEVMIDKKTGEIAIKTTDGDTISYDYITRKNLTINLLINRLQLKGVCKNIYELTNDSLQFPLVVEENTNILSSNERFDGSIDSFMLYIDMSSRISNPGGVSNGVEDVLMDVSGYAVVNNENKPFILNFTTEALNNTVFNISDICSMNGTITKENTSAIVFTSISVDSASFADTFIINSIFLLV